MTFLIDSVKAPVLGMDSMGLLVQWNAMLSHLTGSSYYICVLLLYICVLLLYMCPLYTAGSVDRDVVSSDRVLTRGGAGFLD